MTGAGAVVGTPAFMPPELATGEPCDARSDLYSLGVILYLMGSGRLPFMSESVHELLAMHASTDPAPPMTGVPHRLARVIDKLLRKNPAERYQSATEARNALEESLIAATPPPGGFPDDTNPSIGPFPATTQQFAGMQTTPIPASIVPAQSASRRRSSTAMERIMTGETMLAGSGSAVAASQPGVTSTPGLETAPKKRWPLFAIAGGVVATTVAVIALSMGGGEKATEPPPGLPPKPPDTAITAPEPTPPVPAGKPPEVVTKPPETAITTPEVVTKPPAIKTTTKGKGTKGKGTKGATPAVTTPGTGVKEPASTGSAATKPPGTKPPALPF
jgi:serine/threonine-protein kinase